MTESQRQPVPLDDANELDTALAFLRFARECAIKKTEGLDDEQLRRVLVGTGTNLLGLVQHLTVSERYWFGHHLTGIPADEDWDFGMEVPADQDVTQVVQAYRAAIRASDAAILSADSLDTRTVLPVRGERRSLRWVLAHMTSETARHAGHADILREQIDGTTGR